MNNCIVGVVLAALLATAPTGARAQLAVFDGSAQIEHALIQANTYQSMLTSAQQVQNQLKNLSTNPTSYTNIVSQLNALKAQLTSAIGNTSLASSQSQAVFMAQHPGFVATPTAAATSAQAAAVYQQALGAILAALNTARLQLQQEVSSTSTTATLQTRNDTAVGSLAALQTANNISLESLKQMQRSSTTQAAMMQALLQSAAARQQIDATDRANAQAYITKYIPTTGQTGIWF